MILCVACNLLSKLPAITKGLELAWDLRISQDNLPLRLENALRLLSANQLPATMV